VLGAPRAEKVFCGAEEAVEMLRDVLWVLFEQRALLASVALRPSKGVLVIGPRGTGKALLVQAMADEFGAALFVMGAQEVYRGGAGEGEEMLRQVFRAAAAAACALILCFLLC
jgi:transitional endoplasmic reticulum ATPase